MMDSPRPLLVTGDPLLLDDVIRLATAAGIEVSVSVDVTSSAWSAAPLVLVGDDVLAHAVGRALPRRDSVIVVRRTGAHHDESIDTDVWRGAVAIGAEHVAELPHASRWVVDRLGQVGDRLADGGPVISCVPGVGGAGASTVAALLAREAGGLLVDLDPFGAAIPVEGGVRWPDLAETRGRIPPASLRSALPSVHGVHVLTGTPGERFAVPAAPLATVLEAGARGFPCTVVDTPRSDGDASHAAWSRSDIVVVVLGPQPASAPRALSVIDVVREVCTRVVVLARTAPRDSGMWCRVETDEWQVPFLPVLRHDRTLAQGDHVYLVPRATARRNSRDILAALVPGRAA
ncbi:MAG: septum site-determining protein Ssd [Candidatus Nanopelagicales bacterium]